MSPCGWVPFKIPLGFKNHYDLCWFSQQDCNMSTLLSTPFSITMHIEQFHLLILQPDLDSVMSFFFSFPCPQVLQGLSNDADLTSLWPNPWPNLTEIWDFLQNYPHIFLLFGYPIIRTHVSFISSLHLDPPFSEFSQGKSALSIPPKYHYYLKFKFWVHIGYYFIVAGIWV